MYVEKIYTNDLGIPFCFEKFSNDVFMRTSMYIKYNFHEISKKKEIIIRHNNFVMFLVMHKISYLSIKT